MMTNINRVLIEIPLLEVCLYWVLTRLYSARYQSRLCFDFYSGIIDQFVQI